MDTCIQSNIGYGKDHIIKEGVLTSKQGEYLEHQEQHGQDEIEQNEELPFHLLSPTFAS